MLQKLLFKINVDIWIFLTVQKKKKTSSVCMYVAYVSHSYHILLWTRIKHQVRQYRVFINLNLALSALAHGSFYEHTWLKNRGGRIYVLLKSITYNTLMARAHIMSLLVGPRRKKKKCVCPPGKCRQSSPGRGPPDIRPQQALNNQPMSERFDREAVKLFVRRPIRARETICNNSSTICFILLWGCRTIFSVSLRFCCFTCYRKFPIFHLWSRD